MNTVGNWSDSKAYTVVKQPYVVAIHYAGWGKEAVADLIWNPEILRETLRERATLGVLQNSPRLMPETAKRAEAPATARSQVATS